MPNLIPAARELRKTMTAAEVKLWNQLKARQFHNLKFRKQSIIDDLYIADFLCYEKRLIIEVDGGQHTDGVDDTRTAYLESRLSRSKILE